MIVTAPAKINLTLEVTGVEPNGYHTLDTLFVWLELHDTLQLSSAPRSSLEIRADGVDTSLVTEQEDNLVWRALRALEQVVGKDLPTHMLLTKRIPAGGGLGGGSADAAAALWGLRRLHGLPLQDQQLHQLAARLGADVAFGLLGGLARGRHYGEQLEPLELPNDLRRRQLLLLAPGFPCPTPEVYRRWDQLPASQRTEVAGEASHRFLEAPAGQRLNFLRNDLQAAAEALFPQLATLRQRMTEAGLEGVCLSGSGSTLFGFLPQEGCAEQVEKSLQGTGTLKWTRLREERRGD